MDRLLPVFAHAFDLAKTDQLGHKMNTELLNLVSVLNVEDITKIQAAGLGFMFLDLLPSPLRCSFFLCLLPSYPAPSPAVLFLVVIVGFILIWKCRRTRAAPDTESVGITPLRLRRVQRPISGPTRPGRAGHLRLPSSDTLMTQSSDNVLAMPAQAYIRRAL